MLPPFVPPSARAVAEPLPLITEFVLHREKKVGAKEQGGVAQMEPLGMTRASDEAALPLITEFSVRREPAAAQSTPAPQFTQPIGAASEPARSLEPVNEPAPHDVLPPRVANPVPVVLVPASAVPERAAPLPDAPATAGRADAPGGDAPVESVNGGAAWIDEERNAFDWQSIAGLVTPQSEARRAEDSWAATDWERSVNSASDQVAGLLAQIVRRVRSGELKVEGGQGMSAEAALAATLAALLRGESA